MKKSKRTSGLIVSVPCTSRYLYWIKLKKYFDNIENLISQEDCLIILIIVDFLDNRSIFFLTILFNYAFLCFPDIRFFRFFIYDFNKAFFSRFFRISWHWNIMPSSGYRNHLRNSLWIMWVIKIHWILFYTLFNSRISKIIPWHVW